MSIKIQTSHGELLDKITILQIKNERIKDEEKLENVQKELKELTTIWQGIENRGTVKEETAELKVINEALWEIEDAIREKEFKQEFDEGFIDLARSVYFTNDKRAELKKSVNEKLGSELLEEKSYQDYGSKD